MDSSIDLQQPVIDGGIRSINFFNGRLLSARDLTREQTANREVSMAPKLRVMFSSLRSGVSTVILILHGLTMHRRPETFNKHFVSASKPRRSPRDQVSQTRPNCA